VNIFREGGGGAHDQKITSIHVLPPMESRDYTLVAISKSGFRFYLQVGGWKRVGVASKGGGGGVMLGGRGGP
jgi:hypothetical protein